jgi:ATP-dependent RNA circularization protein (DNA/RNA ligase family)
MEEVLEILMETMPAKAWCIQGEIVGPSIQGNIYQLSKLQFFTYCLKKIEKNGTEVFYTPEEGKELLAGFGIDWVPLLGHAKLNGNTVDSILKMSDGNSVLFPTLREGIVWVCTNPLRRKSFKAVSNDYLILHKK